MCVQLNVHMFTSQQSRKILYVQKRGSYVRLTNMILEKCGWTPILFPAGGKLVMLQPSATNMMMYSPETSPMKLAVMSPFGNFLLPCLKTKTNS